MPDPHSATARQVVISYARKDGTALAEQMERWLGDRGFEVWRDRRAMVAGDEWWRQIRERIEGAHAVLALVTDGALESVVVRRELGVTRRAGTPLMPVCLDPALLKKAPRWLADLDVVVVDRSTADAGAQDLSRLLAQLSSPPPRRPVVSMAPPLPPHHVSRAALRDRITQRLLDESGTGRQVAVVLVGAGGFGKTTLAQEVCSDDFIAAGYPGGVAWVTVGPEARGDAAVFSELISTLLAQDVRFVTVDQALRRLAEILAERRCLLVLDDVWRPGIVEDLRGLAGLLITTREPEVAALDPAGAIDVERLEAPEARLLLTSALGHEDAPQAGGDLLERVATLTDGWPLLISLAAATIRRRAATFKSSLGDAAEWFCRRFEAHGPASADSQRSQDRRHSLSASVDSSLTLFADDEQQRILELAALPRGAAATVDTARRLWGATAGLDEDAADELLGKIAGHFVRIDRTHPARPATLVIHDVMRAHFATLLGDEGLRLVHQRALEALTPAGATWPERVNDRHAADTLSHHLLGAGRRAELITMLTEDQSWLRRSLALTGSPAAFVTDVARVLPDATTPTDPTTLTLLHAASVAARALGAAMPDAALAVLMRLGQEERALNVARLRGAPGERCRALAAILDAAGADWPLREATLDEIERTAGAIRDQREACSILDDLVSRRLARGDLTGAERAAQRVPLAWSKGALLLRVIDASLARGGLADARRLLGEISEFKPRSEALVAVALAEQGAGADAGPQLAEAATLLEGFGSFKDQAIVAVSSRLGRAKATAALTALLPHLGSQLYRGQALAAAAGGRAEAGDAAGARELLDAALQVADGLDDPLGRSTIVSAAVRVYAALGDRDIAMRLVRTTPYPETTAKYLAIELAQEGDVDLAEALAALVKGKKRARDRAEVLVSVLEGRARLGQQEAVRHLAAALFSPTDPRSAKVVAAVARVDAAQAAALAQRIEDPAARLAALLAAALEAARDDPAEAESLLASAIGELEDMHARAGVDQALAPVAAACAAVGDEAAALRLAAIATDDRQVSGPNPRAVALRRAAVAIALTGRLDAAERIAGAANSFDAAAIRRELLHVRAERGDLDGALARLADVEALWRGWPLQQVTEAIARARGAEDALRWWRTLAPREYSAPDGDAQAQIAAVLAGAGDVTAALRCIEPVERALAGENPDLSVSSAVDFALGDLAVSLYRAGARDDARRLVRLADRRPLFEHAWQAEMLAGTGQVDEIERRLAHSTDLVKLAQLWCAAARTLDASGEPGAAARALARAEEPALRSGQGEDVLGIGRMPAAKRAPLLAVAAARAARGEWRHAFRLLGATTPAEFVEQATEWLLASPAVDRDAAAVAVRRMLEIVAWTGPTWAAVARAAQP